MFVCLANRSMGKWFIVHAASIALRNKTGSRYTHMHWRFSLVEINWMKFIFCRIIFAWWRRKRSEEKLFEGSGNGEMKMDYCRLVLILFYLFHKCFRMRLSRAKRQAPSTYGITAESKKIWNENSYVRIIRLIAFPIYGL